MLYVGLEIVEPVETILIVVTKLTNTTEPILQSLKIEAGDPD